MTKEHLLGILFIFISCNLSAQSDIVINEMMAKNTTYAADEAGQFDDYIELRNNSATNWKNLKNWTLTDTLGIPDKWTFPDETTIPPHGYLVLWADEDGGQGDLHVNFKLDGDGEELYLYNQHGELVDQIVFGLQLEDMSYSRLPNGTGDFVIKDGTIGFNNGDTSSIETDVEDVVNIYPNPATDILFIDKLHSDKIQIQIFDLIGNKVLNKTITHNTANIDLTNLSKGMYIITINGSLSDRLIKL